jgi:hypothetical protein
VAILAATGFNPLLQPEYHGMALVSHQPSQFLGSRNTPLLISPSVGKVRPSCCGWSLGCPNLTLFGLSVLSLCVSTAPYIEFLVFERVKSGSFFPWQEFSLIWESTKFFSYSRSYKICLCLLVVLLWPLYAYIRYRHLTSIPLFPLNKVQSLFP